MPITLRIDNVEQITDGGPVEFTAGNRGFDIGRATSMDWVLPDSNRLVSGRHCEIRYEKGEYWLSDPSTNGTFVNGATGRVQSPYRLANGDRLQIGPYYVTVIISGVSGQDTMPSPKPAGYAQQGASYPPPGAMSNGNIWDTGGQAPPERTPEWMKGGRVRPRQDDGINDWVPLPGGFESNVGGAGLGQVTGGVAGSYIPERRPVSGGYAPPPQGNGYPPTGITQMPPSGGTMPGGAAQQVLGAIAAAAGVAPQTMTGRNPEEVAGEIGNVLRIVTEQLMALLENRAQAKKLARSSSRTMIGLDNNNPLKFSKGGANEALQVMFTRSTPGYLGASQSFKEGFDDVKRHELAMFAAMQKALMRLAEDLSPERIEEKATSATFTNKKARAWEIYVERWNAKTEHHDNGILDVFLRYFSDAYDEAARR